MVGRDKRVLGIVAAPLSLLLSACGAGGGDVSSLLSPTSFAQEIGLVAAPASADASAEGATHAAAPPAVQDFANAKWVDYQNGSDNNDGLTKATAWKHAPGDPQATGAPSAYTPQPGDQIVFAAGSHYYGSIAARFTGSASMPVVLRGENEFNPAVIDGSSAVVSAQKCPSQAACHGIAAWREASIAVFSEALPDNAAFFAEGQLLTPAQWPDPEDLFYAGEISQMADVAGTAIAAGAIDLPPALAGLVTFEPGLKVAVWVQPNVVETRPATAIAGGKVLFNAAGLQPYLDRPDKFALRGAASLISIPGEFAILPDRKTVIFKSARNAATLTAATGRSGIDVSGASNVVVENLTFQNFTDTEGNIRSGLPVWALRFPASNIVVQDNIFSNLFLNNGQGAVTMREVDGLKIRRNTIRVVAEGSGMRLFVNKDLVVERNVIERVGRTAIYLASNSNSLVLRNRIRDVYGVHGNGISIYLGNQNTQVIANTVTEAYRPMTIAGNNQATPAFSDALIANNLFVTGENSLGSFTAFGGNGRNIRLVNNVILGSRKGSLRFADDNRDVRIERNVIDGFTFVGQYPSDWVVKNNTYRILGVFQERDNPSPVEKDLAPEFTPNGTAPNNLAQFCPFISEPLDLVFGSRYDRNIGADHVCG